MGSYQIDGHEDNEAVEMLKQSLSDDIRDLLNSSFEIEDDYELTREDEMMMREVSMSALLTNMIDLLAELNLGSSLGERQLAIENLCHRIKDAYLMATTTRGKGEVN
jgi:hypothetical protein